MRKLRSSEESHTFPHLSTSRPSAVEKAERCVLNSFQFATPVLDAKTAARPTVEALTESSHRCQEVDLSTTYSQGLGTLALVELAGVTGVATRNCQTAR